MSLFLLFLGKNPEEFYKRRIVSKNREYSNSYPDICAVAYEITVF